MKKSLIKIFMIAATIAVLFSCLSFSCSAEETSHLHQPNLTASHPVYVYVVYNIDGNPEYIQSNDYDEEEQVYTVTTPDGITIRVWYPKGGLTLVIHEIKEAEPMKWFNGLFPECSRIQPYEIFFLEERGGRINLPDGIRIEMSGLLSTERMTLLNTDEEKTLLPARVDQGRLVFYSSADADYYVLGTLKPSALPQTGDEINLALWIGLAALALMGIMVVSALLLRPAKEDDEEEEDSEKERDFAAKEEDAQTFAPIEKEGGARRRGQKAPIEAGVSPELNRYLNEVEDSPEG